jgi:spoIIIJ-associated protein
MAAAEPEAAELVRALVERVVQGLDIQASVVVATDDDAVTATVHGEDVGLFIGRHGSTIDAVQHLAHRTILHRTPAPHPRVVVDAEGYRARRAEALERQADEAAEDAIRYARPVALDAMGAAERKLVHEYLRERDDVETYSEGDEPDRHLVIAPLSD